MIIGFSLYVEDHSLKVDYGVRLRIKEHPVIDLNSVDSYVSFTYFDFI